MGRFLKNLAGLIVGLIAGSIALVITETLFNLIAKVGFLASILSFPFGFELWSISAEAVMEIAIGMFVADKIAEGNAKGVKWGVVVLAILHTLFFILGLVLNIVLGGFSLPVTIGYVIGIGAGFIGISSAVKGDSFDFN